MNILVLKAGRQPYDVGFIDHLNMYGKETGNTYVMGYLDDLIFNFVGGVSVSIYGEDVISYDLVYFRTWEKRPAVASTLAKHLEANSVKFIDSAVGISNFGSKILQHYLMVTNDLPLPSSYLLHKELLKENFEELANRLGGFPVVLKAMRGNEGKGVFLINSIEDLANIYDSLNPEPYFIQEFIPNDFDYRFVVFGGNVSVVKKRIRNKDSSEFRNNVSLGAEVEYLDPNELPELSDLAVKASKVKSLEVAGVDLVTSSRDGKTYIFEVNPAPAFRHDFTVLKHLDEYITNTF